MYSNAQNLFSLVLILKYRATYLYFKKEGLMNSQKLLTKSCADTSAPLRVRAETASECPPAAAK